MADKDLGEARNREEALLMNANGDDYDLGEPRDRKEALLMKLAEGGGGGEDAKKYQHNIVIVERAGNTKADIGFSFINDEAVPYTTKDGIAYALKELGYIDGTHFLPSSGTMYKYPDKYIIIGVYNYYDANIGNDALWYVGPRIGDITTSFVGKLEISDSCIYDHIVEV